MNKGLLFILILLFVACQNNGGLKKDLIGQWQMVNFSTNQKITNKDEYQKIARQMIMTTSLTLHKDGKAESFIWGSRQNGYWYVKDDYLYVTDRAKKNVFKAKIVKLTGNQLVLYYKEGKVQIMLYFRKDLLN